MNAIITGSNRGIGKATVSALARRGCNVWACARTKTDEFEQFLSETAAAHNVWIKPVYFDVTDSVSRKEAVREIVREKQSIDILVNNAGAAVWGEFTAMPVSRIREIFEVNFFSCLELTQLLFRHMAKNPGGRIINVASVAGIDRQEGNSAYGTSKAALIAWTKTLAMEAGKYKITVNAIAPGVIETDMSRQMGEEDLERITSNCALKRQGCAEEAANVIAFLASEEASYINGQIIRIDGGLK